MTQIKLKSIHSFGQSNLFRLAERECIRYWYLRTGEILSSVSKYDMRASIVLCTKDDLSEMFGDEHHIEASDLKAEASMIGTHQDQLFVIGGSEQGMLFGVYRLCEEWGVSFHLHGDSYPSVKRSSEMEEINIYHDPIFNKRGLHPFHNFPEGPDSWNTGSYLQHVRQMCKMGMNFFGFHSYVTEEHGLEPQVWIGLPEDIDENGKVIQGYSTGTWHDAVGTWNYKKLALETLSMNVGDWVQRGVYEDHADGGDDAVELFERIAKRWENVFTCAEKRGVKTCLGLEVPMQWPKHIPSQLKKLGLDPESREARKHVYRGVFKRIALRHPLSMFWLYVPEKWVWVKEIEPSEVAEVIDEVEMAIEVLKELNDPFKLGVSGWTIGPGNDPLALERLLPKGIPLAALSAAVGHFPISPYFNDVKKRESWPVSWMEDDPRLTVPQLWVGRTLKDAADADGLDCEGHLGIHWRSRCLAPQTMALAKSGWNQKSWNPDFGRKFSAEELEDAKAGEGQVSGEAVEWEKGRVQHATLPIDIFETASEALTHYKVNVPKGKYKVTCYFVEGDESELAGSRRLSVTINGIGVVDKIDFVEIHGHHKVIEATAEVQTEENEPVEVYIRQVIGKTFVNAIQIDGTTDGFNQFEGGPYLRRINCGGPRVSDVSGDWEEGKQIKGKGISSSRALDSYSLYKLWADSEFGMNASAEIARLFSRIDGELPCITFMKAGPGNCTPDQTPWEQAQVKFSFVDELEKCGKKITGILEKDRFHYWLFHFKAFRAAAKLRCVMHQGTREERIQAWSELYHYQLRSVRTPADLGTLISMEHQWRLDNLASEDSLVKPIDFDGELLCQRVPNQLSANEKLEIELNVLGNHLPEHIWLELRTFDGEWKQLSMFEQIKSGESFICHMDQSDLPDVFMYRIKVDGFTPYSYLPCFGGEEGVSCIKES